MTVEVIRYSFAAGDGSTEHDRQEQGPGFFWATLPYDHHCAPANWQG